MSVNLNIDAVLKNIQSTYDSNKKNSAKVNNTQISDNIFAQASAIVAEYKDKQGDVTKDKSKSNGFAGLNFNSVVNMSTSEFLKYAYDNKANSGFEGKSNEASDNKDSSTANIKLPMLVRYKAQVVSTAGKSFMQVVAKLAAKYPNRSEEEIAAELIAKYGDNSSNEKTNGSKLNLSA